MLPFDPATYGPAIAALLAEPGLSTLEIGRPNLAVRDRLMALREGEPFAQVRDRDMATACRAGLFLYFDYFEESHQLSQDLNSAEGSYWHAILHRREPDADNAKYWFSRVGDHPIFAELHKAGQDLAVNAPGEAAFLRTEPRWDAFAFVDLCEAARTGRTAILGSCLAIQLVEWQLLFDHCFRGAVS